MIYDMLHSSIKERCCIVESRGVFVKKKEKLFLKGEIDISELDKDVQKKYELAKELGIYDKVLKEGWGSLTAKETGKLGGVIGNKKRKNSGERVLS